MDAIMQGQDHPTMGVVEVVALDVDLALGMTRGLHPKSYHYTDPNEDVIAVVREGTVTALIAADGHRGFEGSHAAVDGLLDALPKPLPDGLDRRMAATVMNAANDELRRIRTGLAGEHRSTRTTLVLGLVHGAVGARTLTTASVGDSAIIIVGPDGMATQVTRDRERYLGDRYSLPEIAGLMHLAQTPLADDAMVIAATDGLTNFAAIDAIGRTAAGHGPEEAVRRLIALAGEGGAGDNVSVAVLTPPVPGALDLEDLDNEGPH